MYRDPRERQRAISIWAAITGFGVAQRLPSQVGQLLAHAARGAFASGVDLGMLTAAGVAVAGLLIALAWLPRRAR